MPEINVVLSVKKISLTVLSIVIGLVLLHVIAHFIQYSQDLSLHWMDIINRVDVGDEISIPTWASQTLLLTCASVLLLISVIERRQGGVWWGYWLGLSGLFVYASVDEGASLHELLAYLEVPQWLGWSSGYLAFLWVIPGAMISLLIMAVFSRFWWHLPARTKWLILVSGLVFLGGAIGVEMVGANHFSNYGPDSFTFSGFYAAAEEGMEMVGATIFLFALLDYLRSKQVIIKLTVKE